MVAAGTIIPGIGIPTCRQGTRWSPAIRTNDFDLSCAEHADLILVWGVNWITTKMPDGHWLSEARLKGTKVVAISAEYSATYNKANEIRIVRSGTTPALALGLAQVMMAEKLCGADYIKSATDLPLLVRMNTGDLLQAADVFTGYKLVELKNGTTVLKESEALPEGTQESWAAPSQRVCAGNGATTSSGTAAGRPRLPSTATR